MDEMNTTAEPGPAARNGREQLPADHHRGPQVDVERGSQSSSSIGRPRHGPRHPGGMDESAQGAEGGGRAGTAASTAAVSATSTTDQSATTPYGRGTGRAVSSAPSASMSQTATGRPTSARARAVCPSDARPAPGDQDARARGAEPPVRPRHGRHPVGRSCPAVSEPSGPATPGGQRIRSGGRPGLDAGGSPSAGVGLVPDERPGRSAPQSASMAGSSQATPSSSSGL